MSLPGSTNSNLPASAEDVATLPDSVWLQHRNVLHELYISKNKTLNEVKHTMEEVHGFALMRPRDYEVALREVLGLRKNLRGQDWQAIKAHWERRHNQGKKSNVLWNNMIVDERKVRKEIHRKRNRSRVFPSKLGTPELPPGVIIKTPPLSPTASIITAVVPVESRSDQGSIVPAQSDQPAWVRCGSPVRLDAGINFLQPTQMGLSRFQELLKDLPFNVFFVKLMDFSDSYHILDMVPAERAQAPSPRLLGINPSWDLLARITFEISNNMEIDWTDHDSSWFLNWFGMSADLKVLRAFFSIKGPTVCAVYENLCSTVHYLRRPAAANVLFEMLDTVRGNNAIVADALNFLEIAVRIGSTEDGMLRIARRAIERHAQLLNGGSRRERLCLSSLIAASQRDTAMLRLLVDAGARANFEAEFDLSSLYYEDECDLQLRISHQLLSWSPGEEKAIDDFVHLLLEGGFLLTELPPRCYNSNRPEVDRLSGPAKFDEAIMLCPAIKRQALYEAIIHCSGESQNFVRHAGIFTAAAGGVRVLEAYIQSCRQDDEFDTRATMQESLVFAAMLNDTATIIALLQIGTDPSVELLQSNVEEYDKGALPWNTMVIAAKAGSKEALMLLKEWSDLGTFLERAPLFEIVRQHNLDQLDYRCGTELNRLESLRRHLLYDPLVNLESESEIAIKIERSRTNRLELLTWIRSNAVPVAHSAATKFDEDIIAAAVFKAPYSPRSAYTAWTENRYCDVLLLDGLVGMNLQYHESGMDLLQLSIRNQCTLEVVEFLLSKGFKVHSQPATETQNTILHDALLSRSPDRSQIVHRLLRQGANCKEVGAGLTLLEASLLDLHLVENFQDYLDIFQRLLDEGAPVPRRPQQLINLLIHAGAGDDLIFRIIDAVEEVQMQGSSSKTANLNWLPYPPLLKAIFLRRETLARELIRRGANVHARATSSRRFTALQAACSSGSSLEFIEYLVLENGADVNEAPAKELGKTALQRCKSIPVVRFLLDHGADVNALGGKLDVFVSFHTSRRFTFRRRVLDYAAEYGRLDMLEYLLKAGGRSGYGGLRGAILLARERGHSAVLSVLLDWQRKHGSQIVEEEAKWQREHPEAARLLSKTASTHPPRLLE